MTPPGSTFNVTQTPTVGENDSRIFAISVLNLVILDEFVYFI